MMSIKSKFNPSHQSTASYWQDVTNDFEKSGLPISKYCSMHKISTSSFYQWRKILNAERSNEKSSIPSFIPIDINSGGNYEVSKPSLEIYLPSGIKLIVCQGFNVELLGQLLKVVG
jgi:hypothetical protein